MNTADNGSEKMTFVFEGNSSVSVDLLVKTLSGVSESYESMVNSIDDSATLNLNVEAFKVGSFEIVFSSLVEYLPPMLQLFQEVTPTVKTFMEILKIKKDLKGQKPSSIENDGEKTKITNHAGETNYYNSKVTNLYINNPIIDRIVIGIVYFK